MSSALLNDKYTLTHYHSDVIISSIKIWGTSLLPLTKYLSAFQSFLLRKYMTIILRDGKEFNSLSSILEVYVNKI